MGITAINWQTIVELAELDKVGWLYHPSMGVKLRGIATIQHAATTRQECPCVTILLYLLKNENNKIVSQKKLK